MKNKTFTTGKLYKTTRAIRYSGGDYVLGFIFEDESFRYVPIPVHSIVLLLEITEDIITKDRIMGRILYKNIVCEVNLKNLEEI
jgi:hypothetical protein